MANAMYMQFPLAGTIAAGVVVFLNSSGKVDVADESDPDLIGITDEAGVLDDLVRVVIMGRKTIACTGTVVAGDPLTASATPGKVRTINRTSSIVIRSHSHAIDDGGSDGSSGTTGSETIVVVLTAGQTAAANLIGKALTGGTNTDIDVWVKIHG